MSSEHGDASLHYYIAVPILQYVSGLYAVIKISFNFAQVTWNHTNSFSFGRIGLILCLLRKEMEQLPF